LGSRQRQIDEEFEEQLIHKSNEEFDWFLQISKENSPTISPFLSVADIHFFADLKKG
jgi:hypothetical protein